MSRWWETQRRLRLGVFAVAITTLFATVLPASAGTFATYSEKDKGDFHFRSTGSSGGGGSATFNSFVSVPVVFNYVGIAGLPAALQGNQAAHLTFTSSTSDAAFNVGGSLGMDFQGVSDTITFKFTRDTPFAGKTNLLTAVINPNLQDPLLTGTNNSNTLTFQASEQGGGQTVVFTSDFLNFAGQTQKATSDAWTLETGESVTISKTSGFLNPFEATGTGSFTSKPGFGVPEPSSLVLGAVGLVGLLGGICYRRRSAK